MNFCVLDTNSRWLPKWQEKDFGKILADDSTDTLAKNFVEVALSSTVSEISKILGFYAEIQDGHQKYPNNFGQKMADHCRYPGGQKFHQNR